MSTESQSAAPAFAGATRRHDLDALRAFAMLLGIALHAALAFAQPMGGVQDSRQIEQFVQLFLVAIHGFRMPLFFLVSGFFTAMLWRRRGIRSLLTNRARRILLPCMLGLVTIVPALNWVSVWVSSPAARDRDAETDDGSLVAAVRKGDSASIRKRLDDGADIGEPDPQLGLRPLAWAALLGNVQTLQFLIEQGAEVNARNRDGSTPLHFAAFAGQVEAVELLLKSGAKAAARDSEGRPPLDSTKADWETTRHIATLARIPLGEQADVEHGRAKVRQLIAAADSDHKAPVNAASGVMGWYRGLITSEMLNVNVLGKPFHLVLTPVFIHLWSRDGIPAGDHRRPGGLRLGEELRADGVVPADRAA
jgi:hypothetical protein